jgi:hypothetical protein
MRNTMETRRFCIVYISLTEPRFSADREDHAPAETGRWPLCRSPLVQLGVL